MKRILYLLFFMSASCFGATCGALVINPVTSKLDCVGPQTSGGPTAFGISGFSDNRASVIEIGSAGVWEASGGVIFGATYFNGPATSGSVSFSGWTSSLPMTNSFQGPTASTAAVNYPGSAGGTVIFTLSAAGALGSASSSILHTFNNDRYYGTSTLNSGWTSANVLAFGTNDLVNSIPNTFTVTANAGQYIVNAYPSRLGTSSYSVNGFAGGFLGPTTVSVTNASGYTENYYVYNSVNQDLGLTTIVVTTP